MVPDSNRRSWSRFRCRAGSTSSERHLRPGALCAQLVGPTLDTPDEPWSRHRVGAIGQLGYSWSPPSCLNGNQKIVVQYLAPWILSNLSQRNHRHPLQTASTLDHDIISKNTLIDMRPLFHLHPVPENTLRHMGARMNMYIMTPLRGLGAVAFQVVIQVTAQRAEFFPCTIIGRGGNRPPPPPSHIRSYTSGTKWENPAGGRYSHTSGESS